MFRSIADRLTMCEGELRRVEAQLLADAYVSQRPWDPRQMAVEMDKKIAQLGASRFRA